jgi:endonuclease YncB( thermonuclease family)
MVLLPRPRAFPAIAVIWLALTLAGSAAELRGRVVGVADGDTITVLDAGHEQVKVRLNGIDAPESGQAFGQVSKANLSRLVFGQDVVVQWTKSDRYGRRLGTVMVGALNANLEQLRAGLAWYYRAYASDVPAALRLSYDAAESEAKAAKRGLWHDMAPIAPWDYRSRTSTGAAAATLMAPTPAASKAPVASSAPSSSAAASAAEVRGNKVSHIYHVPGCMDYDKIAQQNRVIFQTEAEAVAAGYRKAKNCK